MFLSFLFSHGVNTNEHNQKHSQSLATFCIVRITNFPMFLASFSCRAFEKLGTSEDMCFETCTGLLENCGSGLMS